VCPVTTLQAYELKTQEFRHLGNSEEKKTLFLSWIGKHDPVTGSTIAQWLKTCLQEAGIDTGVFKAHSTRGAAASKAAGSRLVIRKHLLEVLSSLIGGHKQVLIWENRSGISWNFKLTC